MELNKINNYFITNTKILRYLQLFFSNIQNKINSRKYYGYLNDNFNNSTLEQTDPKRTKIKC